MQIFIESNVNYTHTHTHTHTHTDTIIHMHCTNPQTHIHTVDLEPCNDTDVRLLFGQAGNEGTVQLCTDGVWGTVCDDSWDARDAQVVCRQLGLQSEGRYGC